MVRYASASASIASRRSAPWMWRSEERRVGKECRSRWSPDHYKKTHHGRGGTHTADRKRDRRNPDLAEVRMFTDRRSLQAARRIQPIVVFFSSRRLHTSYWRDWSSDVCSSDLDQAGEILEVLLDVDDRHRVVEEDPEQAV